MQTTPVPQADSAILPGEGFRTWLFTTPVAEWTAAHPVWAPLVFVLALVFMAWLSGRVARHYILTGIRRLVAATPFTWDDLLVEHGVFDRLAHVAPALVVYYGIGAVPGIPQGVAELVARGAVAVLVLVGVMAMGDMLDAANEVYVRVHPDALSRPIKGYVQVAKLLVFLVAGILVVAILVNRSPLFFLSGLGALTAVLLLVFRDTILSFVASLQIASNDMLRVGDWIEMPKYGADGDVVDIALHTVKVQNWDRTITSIPTYRFIEDSFRNWRGMTESGGRRIKRAIHLDAGTVRFLGEEELDGLERHELLKGYLPARRREIAEWNSRPRRDGVVPAVRRLTNLGTFRAYVEAYLRAHPKVHQEMTLLVRQLAPGAEGIPLEVYCFTNDIRWGAYEGIQGDIFDHLFSVLPTFGLHPFQSPAGSDVRQALEALTDTGGGGAGPDGPGEKAPSTADGDPVVTQSRDRSVGGAGA